MKLHKPQRLGHSGECVVLQTNEGLVMGQLTEIRELEAGPAAKTWRRKG